jgi:hypothetical protein
MLHLAICFLIVSAEDWNLANPIKTCGFQVERRNNDLYLIFTTDDHTKVFCLAHYKSMASVESVVDSSRYFVTQLVQVSGGKQHQSAFIGFGFRERDAAIDLLGALQQFSRSIQRELKAASSVANAAQHIPKLLGEGETMHIQFGKSSNPTKKAKSAAATTTTPKTGQPMLLKKPPSAATTTTVKEEEKTRVSMGGLTIDDDKTKIKLPKDSEDQLEAAVADSIVDGDGAALDDDDEDWNDFQGA